MDVMNRKLFAGRAARDKLARSAGIMASSEQLMQAAQRYQQGGMVGGSVFDVARSLETIAPGSGYMDVLQGGPRMPPSPALPAPAAPVSRPMYTGPIPRFVSGEVGSDIDPVGGEGSADLDLLRRAGSAIGDFFTRGQETTPGEDERVAQILETTPQAAAQLSPTSDQREVARRAGPSEVSAAAPDSRGGFTFGSSVSPFDPSTLGERVALTFGETGDLDAAAAELIRAGGGEGKKDPAEMTVKERTNELLSMYKDLFGDDDKDVANEKALTMAMIGFAIASGTSPNALENIASGLLSGTKLMAENQSARKKRDEELKMMAFEQAIGEEQGRIEAAREFAAGEAKLGRDIRLEEAKARLGGGSNMGSRTDPVTQYYRLLDTMQTADGTTAFGRQVREALKDVPPDQIPQRLRMLALTELEPAYAGNAAFDMLRQNVMAGTMPAAPASAQDLPVVVTGEDYDALPIGTEFMMDGQRRVKDKER